MGYLIALADVLLRGHGSAVSPFRHSLQASGPVPHLRWHSKDLHATLDRCAAYVLFIAPLRNSYRVWSHPVTIGDLISRQPNGRLSVNVGG
jgi:hypothetical protein